MRETSVPPTEIRHRDFADLHGWAEDDHAAAFRAFRRGAASLSEAPPKGRSLGVDPGALRDILSRAGIRPENLGQDEARRFFETEFTPFEILPPDRSGFFTGYYEPIVAGSRSRTAEFIVPLYRRPPDLVEFDPEDPPAGIDPSWRFARRTATGYMAYADRGEIEAGFLKGRGLELVFLTDPVDAFFIHIQGAARIALLDGGSMRVTYAAKTGHPYTPIGRVLIEMGALEKGKADMKAIRAWLAAHPEAAPQVMAKNRSFIFFREASVEDPKLGPVAAAKTPLTPGRSLAVDRLLHSFHSPVWIETELADRTAFRRLVIAHDTGSAIIGPARGDIFFGSGDEAGALAGGMAAAGRFVLFVPRSTADRFLRGDP